MAQEDPTISLQHLYKSFNGRPVLRDMTKAA